ncbi:MAG: VanW family protein [Patescibacteria group bacterium]
MPKTKTEKKKPTSSETKTHAIKPDAVIEAVKKGKKKFLLIISILIGVILILASVALIVYFIWENKYENLVYPNVYVSNQDMSGKTYLEIFNLIDEVKQDYNDNGFIFFYDGQTTKIPVSYAKDASAGIIVDILKIDSQATANAAYEVGRTGNWQRDILTKLKLYLIPKKFNLTYTLNQAELEDALQNYFFSFETPAQDATLTFNDQGEITVLDEKNGQAFNWEKIIRVVIDNINKLQNKSVAINLETDYPEIKSADTIAMQKQVADILKLAPFTFKHNDKTWFMTEADMRTWLMFTTSGVDINEETLAVSLTDIAKEIDQPVKEGKFSVTTQNDGSVKVEQFQEGEDGLELNLEQTSIAVYNALLVENSNQADLVVATTKPEVTPSNASELGITELLGTGYTNFSGSPYNRIKNISKGADIINGLLIAPGQTFSLITALGHIDGESGWLPELVIKGNKTIPEYGGGLCQVGTTSFRAAMNAGLQIVERQNHSYVVSYYNYNGKPGVDATIYEPHPDFRFKNDTGHYILWKTRIEGYDLYFELWGASDGRKGYFTDPINYNWVSPPESIITEVDSLSPGVLSCSEKAHTGVSASFDYIIDRADGTQDKETFASVYKALPAVCNKGKEVTVDTSTDEDTGNVNINTNANTNTGADTNANTNANTNTTKKKKKDS